MINLLKLDAILNRKVFLTLCLLTTFFSSFSQTKWADWSYTSGLFGSNPSFDSGTIANGLTSLTSEVSSNITTFSGPFLGIKFPFVVQ